MSAASYGWLCAVATALLSSCVIEVNTDPRKAPPTQEELWVEQVNDNADTFNAGAQVFAEGVSLIGAAGARFFWSTPEPALHSYDVLSMKRIDYEVPLATYVYPDSKVGANVIVTAEFSDDNWKISVYAADKPSALIDSITWPVEKDESGNLMLFWPLLSIDESVIYLLNPEKVLYRWLPGMGAPEPLFSLADRGLVLDKVAQLRVHGDHVLMVDERYQGEGSHILERDLWDVGLSGGAAQKVASSTENVCFHAGSVIYEVRDEESDVKFSLLRYSLSDGTTENLTDLIRGTSVDIGGSFIDINAVRPEYSSIGCQPGGFTFDNALGLFFFDLEKREPRALYLKKPLDEETSTYTVGKLVENVAFLWVLKCPSTGQPVEECQPPVVYRRDLPSH